MQEPKAKLPSIRFQNDAVLVSSPQNGAIPLYTALSFLQERSLNSLSESSALIFTPSKSFYEPNVDSSGSNPRLNWGPHTSEDDDETYEVFVQDDQGRKNTRLKVDAWFQKNGLKGETARWLSRIQVVYVDSMEQLAACLASYPTNNLGQEPVNGPTMIIIHDVALLYPRQDTSIYVPSYPELPKDEEERQDAELERYLAIVGYALGALEMSGEGSKLVVFESRFSASTKAILAHYFEEESMPEVTIPGNTTE